MAETNKAQEKSAGLNIRLASVDNSDQPVLANFTRLNGAPGMVFVDFGFLEPAALSALSRLAQSGNKIPETLTGKLAVRVALGYDTLALTEEHDIVYREAPQAGAAAEAPPQAPTGEQFGRGVTPDPVLLFRYSALTFNGHRIHYDRSYVTGVEGYPGLIVHGPLIATLLVDLLRRERPEARLSAFEFRAMSPLFDTAPFNVCGRFDDAKHASLWARGPQGQLAMQASATLA